MNQQSKIFTFTSYSFDTVARKASFKYAVDDEKFEETLSFPTAFPSGHAVSPEILDACLYNLHLILGISYWKTYCPTVIKINTRPLSKEQAEFWNVVYTKGLGEFFFKNKINFRNLVQFPYENSVVRSSEISLSNKSLVGIGGGKDSIVAIEFLKEKKISLTGFILQAGKESKIAKEVATLAQISTLTVERHIDPKLFELNKLSTVYNGHIPISAVYAWVGVLTCLLYDYKDFVVGNEKSASIGNVEYLGAEINHQWSKSDEFEKLFQNYLHEFVTPSIQYYSLLRSYSELDVIRKFVEYKTYFPVFSSCNRNFAITKQTSVKWCGECPKCAFVFAGMAAFLPKSKVVSIFRKNLFADEKLVLLYRQLAGLESMKPFECVGTFEETKLALYMSHGKNEYSGNSIMTMFESDILPDIGDVEKLMREVFS